MATCANCIHHSLCDYNTNISGNGKVRLVYDEGADITCSFFENRADVVPKSEVAREIFEEIEKNECHDISGKTTMYMLLAEEFAELKKKYTEGKG